MNILLTSKVQFFFSSNAERLKQFGKSLSNTSRIYRAKRIDVNVKINLLAYLAEVLGGIIVCCLALLTIPIFMYVGVLMWYGIVIPSCYLINSADNKTSIIEEGWVNVISKLYKKKSPREKYNSGKANDSESCRNNTKGRGPSAENTQEEETVRWASAPKPHSIKSGPSKISKTCEKDSFHTAKFQLKSGLILQDLDDTC